ncbi:O-antigen ligase family protein [Planctomicrobium sp. SH527]|uniref:O-antigen ligase family protein n=1 Tax=Planctomicrobium sp. SH527 TaxID=3448123 RepID=UPI003F5B231F
MTAEIVRAPRSRTLSLLSEMLSNGDSSFAFDLNGFSTGLSVAARRIKQASATKSGGSQVSAWAFWDVVTIALILTRFLVPTEGAEQGQTLWIATGWFALATVRCWWLSRHTGWTFPRWNWTDIGVTLLVAGNCLAAVVVLTGLGDKRAALNGLWEWLSIAVMWFMVRDQWRSESFRRLLPVTLLITFAALALLGLWQHFVWYPQQACELKEVLELRTRIERNEVLSSVEQSRYTELVSTVGGDLLTLDENGRKGLINRAMQSVEPIGRFALANSLATLLVVGLFFAFDSLVQIVRMNRTPGRLAAVVGLTTLLVACLVLTKSRTAVIGVGVAFVWLGIVFGVARSKWSSGTIRAVGVSLVGLVVLVVVLAKLGGLDREVLSEAPKSLQYRLEYWQSTLGVIREHVLFGVGPGNFRQHYIKHKLPGASEEILDPHQFVLDAWAHGGMIALVGVLALAIGWLVWCALPLLSTRLGMNPTGDNVVSEASVAKSVGRKLAWKNVLLVGVAAFGAVLVEEWLFEGFTDDILIGVMFVWLVIAAGLRFVLVDRGPDRPFMLAAGIAIFVHLCGAGGLSMPGVLQLLLLLFLLAMPEPISKSESTQVIEVGNSRTDSQVPLLGATITGLTLTVLCVWTGLLPYLNSSLLLDRARHEMLTQGNQRAVERLLEQAAAADTLSPEPHQQLAMLAHHRWLQDRSNSALFNKSIEELELADQRDPFAAKRQFIRAEFWMDRYRNEPNPEFASEAVTACERGLKQYPQHSPLWALYALALDASGKPASAAIAKALELDDLNRKNQHFDKLLPEAKRKQLEGLSEQKE